MARVLFMCVLLIACTYAQFPNDCPENEEFFQCGACDNTCESEVQCPDICLLGGSCGCKTGYVRDQNLKCIPWQDCPTDRKHTSPYERFGK